MTQCKQSYEEIAIPCNVTVPTVVLQHHHCHVTRSQLSHYTVKTEIVMLLCYNCYVKKNHIITAVSQSQHCHVTKDIAIMSQCYHYFVKMSPLSDHNVTTVWPEYHHCHASLSLFNVMLYHKVSIIMSPRPCQKKCQHCHVTVLPMHCYVTLSILSGHSSHVTMLPLSCPNVNTFTTVMSKCQYFHHCNVQMSTLSPLSCPNVNTLNTVMSSGNNAYKHICDLMQCLLRHDYGNVQASRKPRTRVIIYSVT